MNADQMARAPRFPEFRPFSREQTNDPYPVLARARREHPVFFAPELDCWVVTCFEDVTRIYSEPAVFSNAAVLDPRRDIPPEIAEEFPGRKLSLSEQLVSTDPPAHSRLKNMMTPAFLPARINAREAWVRDLTHRLVDRFEAGRTVDLVEAYTSRIPPAVIGRIIGAREEDSSRFTQWVEGIFLLIGGWEVTPGDLVSAWRGVFEFEDYVRALIGERRKKPQSDLTSDFILAQDDEGGAMMSDNEVFNNIFNVAAAGADTTGVLIAVLIYLLLSHPHQWQAVRDNPTLIPGAIDEAMRFRAPVRGLMRRTKAPVSIRGVPIPADSFVFMHLASANRDESQFAEPDRFDIRRPNAKRHLGFGSRTHACLGANLARLEARVALQTLIERLPGLALVDERIPLDYAPNLILPAVRSLRVRW